MSLLEVRDLSAGYGLVNVLTGLDLDVDDGEAVVVLGANGAGKTTTLRALSGMLPASGEVRFEGEAVLGRRADQLCEAGIADVPQGRGTIVDLTVEENLLVGGYTRPGPEVEADIEQWFGVFPRLGERRNQAAGSMSGGEQQMLAIARAMMSRPRLLLLDEPSLGLAPLVTREVFDRLGDLVTDSGVAVLLVEQNANLALEFATRAYVLEAGRIVGQGTADELRDDESIRKAYLELTMSDFLQYVVIGLGNGAIYAMLGLGLVVIFRATGLLNFAQGEIAMFTTFIVWTFVDLGVPLWLAILLGIAAGFVIGVILNRVVIAPFGDPHEKPLTVVIVTIGLFLGINALAQLIWGTETKALEPLFGTGAFEVGGVSIAWQKVGTLAVLAAECAAFWLIFQRTKVGLAMRAVASNSQSSGLVGIPVSRILMIGWGLAAGIGAVAGSFAAVDRGVDANLMLITLIYALAAVTLGGFDSLVGAVVGGLIVGVVTEVLPKYVSWLDKLPLAGAFALILVVLLVRPEGLFGSRKVSRV